MRVKCEFDSRRETEGCHLWQVEMDTKSLLVELQRCVVAKLARVDRVVESMHLASVVACHRSLEADGPANAN